MRWNRLPKTAILLGTALGLTGCVSPENYETDPVEVTTSRGVVTCQLYTTQMVIWDRAINRPDTMSVNDADRVCVDEGLRQAGKI